MRAIAPAKINLSLKVFPPGSDGYHPLDSIVQTVLGEELWAEPATGRKDKLELVKQPPEGARREVIDVGPSNLVLRAVAALRDAVGAERDQRTDHAGKWDREILARRPVRRRDRARRLQLRRRLQPVALLANR